LVVFNANFPRQFKSNIQFKHQFRFQSSAAGTFNVRRSDLLNLITVCPVNGTSVFRVYAGVKLNQVSMYAVGGATVAAPFTPATLSLEWLSTYGPTTELSDTGNAFEPAKVVSSPPRLSLASFWSLTGLNETDILYQSTVPIGTIVDVHVEIVYFDVDTSVAVTTIAAGSAGQTYAGFLDRSAGAAAIMVPVSYQSLN
jgi:hypothetical protein